MRRATATPIGAILKTYFSEIGIDDKMNEQHILDAFNRIAGTMLCKYVTRKYINNNILYLHISNSILRQEISISKCTWIERLNNEVNPTKKTIVDIIVK